MKPIKDWTHEEKDCFIALLRAPDVLLRSNYRYHNSFEEVKFFMEKEWPELWEEYLGRKMIPLQRETFTETLNDVLDIFSLIAFLLEPEQIEKWGWLECMSKGLDEGTEYRMCTVDLKDQKSCNFCDRRIKHPALIYAEGINKVQTGPMGRE